METSSLKNLIKTPTCFKTEKGRCIDLILTNRYRCFQHSIAIKNDVSDHHTFICTVLKKTVPKLEPKNISYRSLRNFSLNDFNRDLHDTLSNENIEHFEHFQAVFEKVLDRHAPKKINRVRGNHKPYITKEIRKAIMLRSFYKNKLRKTKDPYWSTLYKRQRNLVVSLNRSTRKKYYAELGTSQPMWSEMKPFFSDADIVHEKIS